MAVTIIVKQKSRKSLQLVLQDSSLNQYFTNYKTTLQLSGRPHQKTDAVEQEIFSSRQFDSSDYYSEVPESSDWNIWNKNSEQGENKNNQNNDRK